MSKSDKVADAEAKAARWLADGNYAQEIGAKVQAEKCYAKAQVYLDRANRLRGNT